MSLEGVNRIVLVLLVAAAVAAVGAALALNWAKPWPDIVGYGLTALGTSLSALAGFFGYVQQKKA